MNSLMNTREAAEYLKLHYVTLYKLSQQGHIPASKIGGAWRFNKDVLDRWLAQQSLGVLGNVLIVDDDSDLLEILRDSIEPAGYIVETAGDGERAVEMIDFDPPDVVVLDFKLPGMSGLEVMKKMKGVIPELPVIMITAFNRELSFSEVIEKGACALLTKPLDPYQVREWIEKALEE